MHLQACLTWFAEDGTTWRYADRELTAVGIPAD